MTVTRFENGHSGGASETQAATQRELEQASVEFVAESGDSAGAKLRKETK